MDPGTDKRQLEQTLYEFEQRWINDGTANIEEFLPDTSCADYLAFVSELVRCDMEFRREQGEQTAAAGYFERFPLLAADADARSAVVFEEYRLRNVHGENVSATELCREYDVEGSGWPNLHKSSPVSGSSIPLESSPCRRQIEFPSVGESFLDFELVGNLGEGAFGKVFLAQQDELAGRLVVLKFTSARTDEHKLLAQMQHTHIVPVYSVHRAGDLQAICMPLLGIATLQDILRQCGKPDHNRSSLGSNALIHTVARQCEDTIVETIDREQDVELFRHRRVINPNAIQAEPVGHFRDFTTRFIRQTAEGLGYAHNRGITHGDLKPANILVDDDGNAVILDFHLGRSQQHAMGTHTGGTVPYMAPEQLRTLDSERVETDAASDVYSAGVILFEMLTGRLPINRMQGEVPDFDKILAAKERPFVVTPQDRKTTGEDLAAIIETCLAPDPSKRFRNGTELAEELERSLSFQPLKKSDRGSFGNRLRKWASRHPVLSSTTMVLAVSSILIAAAVTSFFIVERRLKRLNAVATSEQHIELARSVNPQIATAYRGQDNRLFHRAVERASEVIELNQWQTPDQLADQSSFRRLDESDSVSERESAAELHFWIAEAYRQIALSTEDPTFLEKAIEHNTLCSEFWPAGLTKHCLEIQSHLIRNPADSSAANVLNTDADNRADRMLTAYLHREDPRQAEKQFDRIVEESPDGFLAWLLLGNMCAAQDKIDKAIACYTVCHSLNPDSALPVLYRAVTELDRDQMDMEAVLHDLELADRLSPDDISVNLNLALALIRNRDFPGALTRLDRAIDLGASQTRVWYLRSRVREQLNDSAGAKSDYETFMNTQPTDTISCITRGNLKVEESPADAILDFELALKINPGSSRACNNLAYVYSEILKQTEKGIEYLDRAIRLDHLNADLFASRGVLLARNQQREAAIRDAESALRLSLSPKTLYKVAGIYAQTSKAEPADAERAVALFSQAAYADPGLVLKELANDPDIQAVADHEVFKTVIDAIQKIRDSRNEISNK